MTNATAEDIFNGLASNAKNIRILTRNIKTLITKTKQQQSEIDDLKERVRSLEHDYTRNRDYNS